MSHSNLITCRGHFIYHRPQGFLFILCIIWPIMHLWICLAFQQERDHVLKSAWSMTNFILLSCFTLTHYEGLFLDKSSPHDCSYSVANRTTPSLPTHTIPASPRLTQCFLPLLWKHLGSLRTPSHRLTQSSDHKPTAAPSDEVASSCSSCLKKTVV